MPAKGEEGSGIVEWLPTMIILPNYDVKIGTTCFYIK